MVDTDDANARHGADSAFRNPTRRIPPDQCQRPAPYTRDPQAFGTKLCCSRPARGSNCTGAATQPAIPQRHLNEPAASPRHSASSQQVLTEAHLTSPQNSVCQAFRREVP